MKADVNYKISDELKKDIVQIKDTIINKLDECDVYLFGSIAKGRYKKESDIDILILINRDLQKRELRSIRHSIEDEIDKLHIGRDVDIKLYFNSHYYKLAKNVCFEREILNDLIDIRRWK